MAPLESMPPSMAMAAMGMSQARFTAPEKEALKAPFGDDEMEIKGTGEVYVSQVFVRNRLNDVFGPGDWGMMSDDPVEKGGSVIQKWRLAIRGSVVAEAFGEAKYQATNKRHSWGRALESAKSNALTRCAKDLGIAAVCWNKRWQYNYRIRNGVLVEARDWRGNSTEQWRHVDSPPLETERGISADSPNQDRYLPPTAARRAAAASFKADDGDTEAAAELTTEVRSAVPYGDKKIGDIKGTNPAMRSIHAALRTHGRTKEQLKAWIKETWGYDSTKEVLQSQVPATLDWIRSPAAYVPGADEPLEGEVVGE